MEAIKIVRAVPSLSPLLRSPAAALCAAGLIALCATAPVLAPRAAFAAAPAAGAPPAKEAVHPIVTLQTDKGSIKIKLYPEDAPIAVANFLKLVKSGFYNGIVFHRVEPGFVIQAGDPTSRAMPKNLKPEEIDQYVEAHHLGTGGPGYTIKDETNKLLIHNRGAVGMAKSSAPDSAGSQFYIVIGQDGAHSLDYKYTVFGQVIDGEGIAEKIAKGDRITKAEVSDAKSTKTTATSPAPAAGKN